MLHIHITCLHVYIVYIYLHLLPRTPDCVMAEARITEFFGETQTDGRSVRFSRGSLGFHGIGVVHAKGSLEVALPPTSSLMSSWNPPRRQGLGSHVAWVWALYAFLPPAQHWTPPRMKVLFCHAIKWALYGFVPVLSIGHFQDGKHYLAILHRIGPFMLSSPCRAPL